MKITALRTHFVHLPGAPALGGIPDGLSIERARHVPIEKPALA